MYNRICKPVFDFLISLFLLVIFSPVMILTTLLLLILNGGSPFFIQSRPGKNGRIFRVIKFKTMNDKRDEHGNLLKDHLRTTGAGKVIRQVSLDELPQLINVLKGDMSLVGPRPLLEEYLPYYSEFQNRRHEVRPGITGLAQTKGRNTLSWDHKFDLDVEYVDHISFGLDLKILFQTFVIVIRRDGVNFHENRPVKAFPSKPLRN